MHVSPALHDGGAQILSLTEKLRAKDSGAAIGSCAASGGLVGKAEALAAAAASKTDNSIAAGVLGAVKAEDHLSTGSGGSAVVDQESPPLVDSGDSHLPEDVGSYHGGCGNEGLDHGGVQSEEDDGSDIDGRGYFSGVFDDAAVVAHGHQHPEEEEEAWNALGWWVWS